MGAARIWTTREKLAIASFAMRTEENEWSGVEQVLAALCGEGHSSYHEFTADACANQFEFLLRDVGLQRPVTIAQWEQTPDVVSHLTQIRIGELEVQINEQREEYQKLEDEFHLIESGAYDDRLDELLNKYENVNEAINNNDVEAKGKAEGPARDSGDRVSFGDTTDLPDTLPRPSEKSTNDHEHADEEKPQTLSDEIHQNVVQNEVPVCEGIHKELTSPNVPLEAATTVIPDDDLPGRNQTVEKETTFENEKQTTDESSSSHELGKPGDTHQCESTKSSGVDDFIPPDFPTPITAEGNSADGSEDVVTPSQNGLEYTNVVSNETTDRAPDEPEEKPASEREFKLEERPASEREFQLDEKPASGRDFQLEQPESCDELIEENESICNELLLDTLEDSHYETARENSPSPVPVEKAKPEERKTSSSKAQADSNENANWKAWKKSIMILWKQITSHRNAPLFMQRVTDDIAPNYSSTVYRAMDLSTLKKNIEIGIVRTTSEFQRELMLMFQNALMYNNKEHAVYKMAEEMQSDVMDQVAQFLATQIMVDSAQPTSNAQVGSKQDPGEDLVYATSDMLLSVLVNEVRSKRVAAIEGEARFTRKKMPSHES